MQTLVGNRFLDNFSLTEFTAMAELSTDGVISEKTTGLYVLTVRATRSSSKSRALLFRVHRPTEQSRSVENDCVDGLLTMSSSLTLALACDSVTMIARAAPPPLMWTGI